MLTRVSAILLVVLITGCSTVDLSQYRDSKPVLDLFSYFTGQTKGWGVVQDRKGNVTRQFVVMISGSTNDAGALVLDEHFTWNDGTTSRRVWTIEKVDANRYRGRAADVVGEAHGIVSGNVLNWRYDMEIAVDNSQWVIHLDDWMFLQPDGVLLNRAHMSKFGIRVGDITIAFQKKGADEQ